MSIFSSTIVNMSIETPDGVLDVTNATLRVPQIEVQGTSVTTSLSTLSNVGVGTASPDGRLHVYGPDAKTLLQSTSNTANVEIGGPSGAIVDLKGPFTDDYDLRIQSSSDGGNLATTGNVNHIRLASASGYTGFGTSAPQYKIDVQGVKGVDAVSNPSAYNAVFLYDDQESTTTFSGTVGGTGASRDTSSKYLELNSLADNVTGYVYWPIQMPNSWSAEFDYYVAGGDGGESVSFSFFNTSAPTTTGNHGGYRLAIAENYGGSPAAKVVLYYQGSEVAQSDIAGGIPTSSWNKVVVNYNRGSISLGFNGRSVFSYEATENADSYTGRYTGFIGKTNLRNNYHRVRNVKCTSGTNWVYATGSNATTLAYLSGNVGIGTDVTTERLEISGNVKATHFVGDGGLLSNIATTLNAIVNQGNTTSNTVQFTNADTGIVATGNIVVEEGGFFVGDGSKLVNIPTDFESIIVNGNTTSNVVYFANTDVAIQASGNVVVDSDSFFIGNGGLLSNIATTLEDISNQGNTTSNTIQFTNSDIGFVTTANVGIANSAPTNHLSVGSNLHVNDTGSNVLTVHGNVAANTLTLGDFQVVASYGLNHVTAENNQTGDTLVLTNATKGIDASSNIDLGGQLNFDSNVKIVGGGTGTYVNNLRIAPVASNIVTYDQATGEVFDSGGLISNKLAIVSEQPPAALTGDSTVVDGHGRYKVTTSLEASGFKGYKVFDKTVGVNTNGWSTGAVGAYNNDGTYAGSNTLASVNGEWIKLELPYKTTLRHVALAPRDTSSYSAMPEDFSIVASNDDSTWVVLKSVDGQSWSSTDDVNFVVDASTAYKYYAIVVELTNNSFAQIGEWKLFTETFSVDAGVVSTTAASGLDVGYTEHPVEPIVFDEITGSYPSVGKLWNANVDGHGTYEITASSFYEVSAQTARAPWRLFNHKPTDRSYWQQAYGIEGQGVLYNTSSPYEYVGTQLPDTTTTDVGGTRYMGHWVQIKVPYVITLAHTDVYRTPNSVFTDASNRAPGAGVFLGSNDGENWYKLTEFSGASYTTDDKERINVNATTPYQYYRFVITNIVGGNSASIAHFNEWRLFAEKPVTRMENVHISGDLSSETLQTGYIKWPRKSLKANESEGYVASASNVYNTDVSTAPYTAFNNYREVKSSGYADAFVGGNGDFTAGVANKSRTTGTDTFNHEWLQIQLPRAITLSYFTLLQRVKNVDNPDETPKNGRMYGSNDGVSWTKLVTFSNLTYERYEETRVEVKSTTPYSYYRLAVTEVVGSRPFVAVGELQLFEAATGVGAAPTSAKLQVAGSLGMAKGAEFFAGDDVVMELPKHDRPLVKYPEIKLTSASSYAYENGYQVQHSSENSSHPAYNLFDGSIATRWLARSTNDPYSATSPYLYTGSSNITEPDGTQHPGAWVRLELPKAIKLSHVVVKENSDPAARTPGKITFLGSNDDQDWYFIKEFSGMSNTATQETYFINETKYYKHLAFVVKNLSDNDGALDLGEVEYWGTEEGDESVDIVHRSIPNTPGTQQLAVYYEARDPNSYSFADSTKVYDLSGSGVTGTLNGVGYDAVDNAFTFDGVNDYISGTLSNPAGEWVHSISFWMKRLDNSSIDCVFAIGTGGATDRTPHCVIDTNKRIRYDFWSSAIYVDGYPIQDGVWYHVCITYSGGVASATTVKFYIDGFPRTTYYDGSGNALNASANSTLKIGMYPDGSEPFAGSIANFRLYSKALSADQVRELYEYDAPRFGHRQNVVALHKGNLGVGVTNPGARFHIKQTDLTYGSGIRLEHSTTGWYWDIFKNGNNDLNFSHNGTVKAFFDQNGANNVDQNFTGQHRTFIKNTPFTQATELEGLIVSADNNKYIKMSGGIEAGSNAITTNESLPLVSLSNIAADKKCFGVISGSEDPDTRQEQYGNFVSVNRKELGDTRVYINSVGEGAMWVVNTAGPLESGDYITTSNVTGYGQKQDSEFLANYTVAKITMDCDFDPQDQPIQRIKQSNVIETHYTGMVSVTRGVPHEFVTTTVTADDEWSNVSVSPSDVTYAEWSNLEANVQNTYTLTYTQTSNVVYDVKYTKTTTANVTQSDTWDKVYIDPPNVSYEEWSNLEANVQNTYTLTYTMTTKVEATEAIYSNLSTEDKELFVPTYYQMVEQRVDAEYPGAVKHETVTDRLENALDEHGQLQWEDDPSGAIEKAYKIRYLDASGAQTDEANAVHTAAFVGVTYHCG
jgi:hypothetical protein